MRAVLDTNVLLAGHQVPVGYDDVRVSALTWAEIRQGIGKYRGRGDVSRAVRFENEYRQLRTALGAGLPFDDAAAARFQALVELTHLAGRESRGRVVDLMIAATAVAHGADLVTANLDDFRGLDDLLVVVPPTP